MDMMNEQLQDTYGEGTDEMKDKYLTFLTDGQVFAIPIADVMQIVQMQKITPIPEFPMYAKGVIDLRGSMIPVVDLRCRLGRMELEYDAHTCIIVMSINGSLVGLIVDSVDEVARIGQENICPPPALGTDTTSRFLQGLGKTPDGVVLLLAIERVIGEDIYSAFSV